MQYEATFETPNDSCLELKFCQLVRVYDVFSSFLWIKLLYRKCFYLVKEPVNNLAYIVQANNRDETIRSSIKICPASTLYKLIRQMGKTT